MSRKGVKTANLIVYCNSVSILDELVLEDAWDVDSEVIEFPVAFILETNQRGMRREYH